MADLSPAEAEGAHRQGLIAAQDGRWDEAAELIAAAITARPGVAQWWANYGLVLESLGDALGAVQAYAGALNLDGGVTAASRGLRSVAGAVADVGRRDLAEDCYRRALALDPADAGLWRDRSARVLSAEGRIAEAMAGLERAGRLTPAD